MSSKDDVTEEQMVFCRKVFGKDFMGLNKGETMSSELTDKNKEKGLAFEIFEIKDSKKVNVRKIYFDGHIKGFEGDYKISNYNKLKSIKFNKERIIKEKTHTIYNYYSLCKNGKRYEHKTHLLVWDHFGSSKRDGIKLQVDHIDEDKKNNHIDNLQLLKPRSNVSKAYKKYNTTSNYTGVSWFKQTNRWKAGIRIDGKMKHLGYFLDEYEAHLAYKKELDKIETITLDR